MVRMRILVTTLAIAALVIAVGLEAMPARSATTFTVNTTSDAADITLADGICDSSASAGTQCSLRAAIQEANATAGHDTINFAIGSGQVTIDINASGLGALPGINDIATIDGTTQPGYNAASPTPMIELKGTLVGGAASGLILKTSGAATIKGLAVTDFPGNGIFVDLGGTHVIQGTYAGLRLDGTTALGNDGAGIFVGADAESATIGGNTAAQRNVISANGGDGIGVVGGSSVVIKGNYIGLAADGITDLGNGDDGIGECCTTGALIIGGSAAGERNIISGNARNGIQTTGDGIDVISNYIGTDVTGLLARPNLVGIRTLGDDMLIGGSTAGSGNVISGNAENGIQLLGSNADVFGNLIGLAANGTSDLGNTLSGILLDGDSHIIGSPGISRNYISGNNLHGIEFGGGVSNVIINNYIGTDLSGTLDRGNTSDGIRVDGVSGFNTIGSFSAGRQNVISGNNSDGIELVNDTTGLVVIDNYIGTSLNGLADLGNTTNGIRLDGNGNDVLRNVISGNNNGDGIDIQGGSSANDVFDNLIGVAADGVTPIANGDNGIQIQGDSDNNNIGSANAADANTIAHNGIGSGIAITASGQGNQIGINSIHSNGSLGIDLDDNAAVNANDIGSPPAVMPDLDAGANNLQNFPAMLAAFRTGLNAGVVYRLDSTPSTAFTMRFYYSTTCDASGNGEGQNYIGSFGQATDPNGLAIGSPQFAVHVPPGAFVTATATGAGNNTSEFSNCIPMNGYVVNSTADPGDGTCDGTCTLRDAILNANAVAGLDRIQFNITPSGAKTISPTSPLPVITDPVIIDGQTQPGFAGTPIIEIDGTNAGDGADGLVISAGSSTVKGLVINRFTATGDASGDGIILHTGGNNVIQANYIGTNIAGSASSINRGSGIVVASANNTIGGIGVGIGNLLSGNRNGEATEEAASGGVKIVGPSATGNVVLGNTIGTNAAATAKIANIHAVLIENANGNTIGGPQMGAENIISGGFRPGVALDNADNNTFEGNYIGTNTTGTLDLDNNESNIRVLDGSDDNVFRDNVIAFGTHNVQLNGGTGNHLTRNEIYGNFALAIDIGDDNVPGPNDFQDPDTGPNNRQNHAVLHLAVNDSDQAVVSGTLNSTPNTTYTLEYFYNPACPSPDVGAANQYLATLQITTNARGSVEFTHAVPRVGNYAPASGLTATVTDPAGNTSELSPCVTTTTDADGDGVGDLADNCPLWPNAGQALPTWPIAANDADCDGFSAEREAYFLTDPAAACGFTAGGDLGSDSWPVDLFESNTINTTDVLQLRPVYLQAVPPAGSRYDLFPDGIINTTDVLQLRPFYLMSCAP